MFKNLSYKQKFLGLIVIFVIMLMASYKKTFKHIIAAKTQISSVNEKLSDIEDSYNQLFVLKRDISIIDDVIGGQTETPEQVQQNLLDFVSNSNYEINVFNIEDTHIYNDDEFLIYTNIIEIEGDYENLIYLFHDIEKDFMFSKVISANMFSVKNYRTNSKKLYLKLIVQNYEKNKK